MQVRHSNAKATVTRSQQNKRVQRHGKKKIPSAPQRLLSKPFLKLSFEGSFSVPERFIGIPRAFAVLSG